MVRISVIGCGLMGQKIAGQFAYNGHRVKVYDNNLKALDSVFQRLEEDKVELRRDGLLLQPNFTGQVLCLSHLDEAVSDADFIFECIAEDYELKKTLLEKVCQLCKPTTIVASNTLRLELAQMVENCPCKERIVGLRFLYPVYYIPEVELTPSSFTTGHTIERVRQLLEKMGKTLFFRSGSEPLVLNEEHREARKQARIDQLKGQGALPSPFDRFIPSLLHHGNWIPEPQSDPGMQYVGAYLHVDSLVPVPSKADSDCAICMDRSRDSLLRPCHHMVTCFQCARTLINRRDGCPVCRRDISEIIRVYHS